MHAASEGFLSEVRSAWPRLLRVAPRFLLVACLIGASLAAVSFVSPSASPFGSVVMAQEGDAGLDAGGEDAPRPRKNALVYIAESCGWIFGPVFLVLSFIFVALLAMCFLQIRKAVLFPPELATQFEQHLEAKEYQPAYELAKNDDSYLGHVLAAGMGKLQSGYPAAVEAMEEAQGNEQMKLEHKISYVSLVGALAPMLGLLGTVQGMVDSFKTISDNPGVAPKPDQLATGIATALVTTLIGLWIAIPAIMFFQLFKNWLEDINATAADESTRLMSRFQSMGKK
ncbi:MAG: MotA/TolQ/ExbB proton channel family protein [Planctomycetia bacterium]|nr:MotA/TolQ/ExbB proton channel family protein [Planctomycetia bacterium]